MQAGFNLVAAQTKLAVRRVRTFDRHENLTDMFECLRAERFTGTVEVHYGQGTVHFIQVQDNRPLDLGSNMS